MKIEIEMDDNTSITVVVTAIMIMVIALTWMIGHHFTDRNSKAIEAGLHQSIEGTSVIWVKP